MSEAINVGHLEFPGMSQAVRVGDAVYLSGQVALGEDGAVVGRGDPEEQAAQCFRNLAAVLDAAGSSMADVVQLTCYLTDADYFPAYSQAKRRWFTTNPPASTTVVVAALLNADFLIEVAGVAVTQPTKPREEVA
jgi:2-iminobutanoate/2-iminopropanoate deaminase